MSTWLAGTVRRLAGQYPRRPGPRFRASFDTILGSSLRDGSLRPLPAAHRRRWDGHGPRGAGRRPLDARGAALRLGGAGSFFRPRRFKRFFGPAADHLPQRPGVAAARVVLPAHRARGEVRGIGAVRGVLAAVRRAVPLGFVRRGCRVGARASRRWSRGNAGKEHEEHATNGPALNDNEENETNDATRRRAMGQSSRLRTSAAGRCSGGAAWSPPRRGERARAVPPGVGRSSLCAAVLRRRRAFPGPRGYIRALAPLGATVPEGRVAPDRGRRGWRTSSPMRTGSAPRSKPPPSRAAFDAAVATAAGVSTPRERERERLVVDRRRRPRTDAAAGPSGE